MTTGHVAGYSGTGANGCGCCTQFLSGRFVVRHNPNLDPDTPWSIDNNWVNEGYVYLFKYQANGGSGGSEDVALQLDITPIAGQLCQDLFYQTFTLNIIGGGTATYQYVSGSPFAGTANLTVIYGGQTYVIEDGPAEGAFAQGLNVYRANFTTINGDPP